MLNNFSMNVINHVNEVFDVESERQLAIIPALSCSTVYTAHAMLITCNC